MITPTSVKLTNQQATITLLTNFFWFELDPASINKHKGCWDFSATAKDGKKYNLKVTNQTVTYTNIGPYTNWTDFETYLKTKYSIPTNV